MVELPVLMPLPTWNDERGLLTAVERTPFEVKRAFWLHDVKGRRGGHAHRRCHQLLVCLHGQAHVWAGDWDGYLLSPLVGLHVPPGNYVEIEAPGAVVLVLCSEYFDADDYVTERGIQ